MDGLFFARFGQGGRFKGQAPKPEVISQVVKNPSVWAISAIFIMALGSGIGLYSLLPLFLINEHSFDRTTANLLVSMCRFSGFVMVFVAGWLTDRLGPRRTLNGVMVTAGLATILLGMAKGTWLLVLIFLQPALVACFFSPIFAAMAFLSKPETRHLVVSFSMALAIMLGTGALPAGICFLGEMGHFGWGITATGVLILCGLSISPFLKFPQDGS